MKNNSTFTPPQPLKTAVLFIIFNRRDTTEQVFKAIRQAKPPRLYIASDGARNLQKGEDKKVKAVRDYVVQQVDWKCEVKTLFREQNLGCKYAVSGAIDWFFENEEKGIILEGDCLPSQSFFWFCEELLDQYKNDLRVWHISGNNFQNGIKRGDGDYYFSKYSHIWGWASWRNRWQYYDVEIKSFSDFQNRDHIKKIFKRRKIQKHWLEYFNNTVSGKIETWDYQWLYACLVNNALSIVPNTNLVKNIGFNIEALHTTDENSELSNLEINDINFPLLHTRNIESNVEADKYTEKHVFKINNILERIIIKSCRFIIGKKFIK